MRLLGGTEMKKKARAKERFFPIVMTLANGIKKSTTRIMELIQW